MREPVQVIALSIADLHLTLTQPVCRADEDWMAVQAGYLQSIRQLAKKAGDVPILCAGDIFDRWNAVPELVNFAIEHLPDEMICVPGQHDLPNHRIEDMHRSGYGVLSKVKKIRDISGKSTGNMGGFIVHGFGWDQEIAPPKVQSILNIALVHRYCWTVGKSYPGAPEELNIYSYSKALKGYDIAVFGDNHKGFIATAGKCSVVNCGGLIRRKSDERSYKPCAYYIYEDATIERIPLDTSADRFHDNVEEREAMPLNVQDFIEGLEGLGEHGLNFREAVINHLRSENLSPETKEIILAALEAKK